MCIFLSHAEHRRDTEIYHLIGEYVLSEEDSRIYGNCTYLAELPAITTKPTHCPFIIWFAVILCRRPPEQLYVHAHAYIHIQYVWACLEGVRAGRWFFLCICTWQLQKGKISKDLRRTSESVQRKPAALVRWWWNIDLVRLVRAIQCDLPLQKYQNASLFLQSLWSFHYALKLMNVQTRTGITHVHMDWGRRWTGLSQNWHGIAQIV